MTFSLLTEKKMYSDRNLLYYCFIWKYLCTLNHEAKTSHDLSPQQHSKLLPNTRRASHWLR